MSDVGDFAEMVDAEDTSEVTSVCNSSLKLSGEQFRFGACGTYIVALQMVERMVFLSTACYYHLLPVFVRASLTYSC